jgi:pimeloyl-ACP methyl ester carboxylesterase
VSARGHLVCLDCVYAIKVGQRLTTSIQLTDATAASGVPALVLWGDQDTFLPIATVGHPLAALLGAPLIHLPGGHFTPLDCPGDVATALRTFLARLPRY